MLTKWGLRLWNGFIWLRIGTSSGLLWRRQCAFVSPKKGRILHIWATVGLSGTLYHAFRYLNEVTVWSRVHHQKLEDKSTSQPVPSMPVPDHHSYLSVIQRYGCCIAMVNKLNTIFILDLNVRWERCFGFPVFSSGAQGWGIVSPSRYFYFENLTLSFTSKSSHVSLSLSVCWVYIIC
jgi:hypothetical protein